ncbi:replication initiation factor domain-containing protein [Candidatus Thiothrix sp. Deng01]|uniref:Replication initiation factor domain-containing protein n=1 Tax=Candidatus Thiothrix phosphatis TaxID=3112415 RepID=A0ABU6CYR2_9GAMM|nr:replication initiation factor domain-containing protein [Candidatus Thiothrix sp. Deng01]MEB4591229.1 replication initiation factor domain-containing protein [Candidatus Thiothrix sp. Deng01]
MMQPTTEQRLDAQIRHDLRRARGFKSPPYCNTGGYGDSKNFSHLQNTPQPTDINVTAVDWLRVTCTDLDGFNATMGDLTGDGGILDSADMDVRWAEKGMHGYEKSASVLVWRDNDYLTVGHIAYAESGRNRGGLFELTGTGCKALQLEHPALWLELFDLLQCHGWRISRVDVALDLSGEYASEHGYTVPKLFEQAVNSGLFQSDRLRNPNMKQSFSMAGDWSPLAVGNLTPATYDPLEHCPAGLTAYIGSRKAADDFFRVYEKGKELLGAMAEPDNIDRGWIRIEHEMSRKASGREIPLDVMIRPDHHFAANRAGVRAILDQLREHQALQAAKEWQREQFKREKSLLLSKKVHWARHSYGRLVRTLTEQGFSAEDIIGWLSRTAGLKEFVFDLTEPPAGASGGCSHEYE